MTPVGELLTSPPSPRRNVMFAHHQASNHAIGQLAHSVTCQQRSHICDIGRLRLLEKTARCP
jgi:hypothetical protein